MAGSMRRRLATAWIAAFSLSVAFPILGSLIAESARPPWLGPLDVAIAALTMALGFYLLTVAGPAIDQSAYATGYRIVRLASTGLLVLIVVFFVAPHAVDWVVLAIGLAWRAWLAVVVLPGIIVHLVGSEGSRQLSDAGTGAQTRSR